MTSFRPPFDDDVDRMGAGGPGRRGPLGFRGFGLGAEQPARRVARTGDHQY